MRNTSGQVHKSPHNLIGPKCLPLFRTRILPIQDLVVVVDKFAEQGIGGTITAGGGGGAAGVAARRAVLRIPEEAMPEVHGAEALHPSLQIAIDRTTVREWLVHQLLLIALFALVGQDVQAAGGDRSK